MSGIASARASRWLAAFADALQSRNAEAAQAQFAEACFWRDLLCFTWNIRTEEGRGAIRAMLDHCLPQVQPVRFALQGEASENGDGAEAWFTFETRQATALGHVRIDPDGRATTLLTAMLTLKGHEERTGMRRERGVQAGAQPGRKTWLEERRAELSRMGYTEQPYVLVVGGGQGGIVLAARLRRLGVPTIVADRQDRPGDSWRKRYKNLCLHDPVWYDHLPFLPFPDDWPVFSAKDKIADWLEMYAKVMEVNYWGSTSVRQASFDETRGEWEVLVERAGHELVLRPRQLVFALGVSGYPSVPRLSGADAFRGDQHHSSRHPGPEGWRGKQAVVLGSGNSAHDICTALWEQGAEVTMIQRSSTLVAPSDSVLELALGPLYSEQALARGISHERADLLLASVPYRLLAGLQRPVYEEMRRRHADLYARLEQAGFLLDFGEDGSGLLMKYLRRGSGYTIDTGASELIANGSIRLRSRVGIERVLPRSVLLTDGSELEADLLVYATGYGPMNQALAELVSPEVAERVGKVWGLGSNTQHDPGPWEGELRNLWKPTRQKQLWIHGGNLQQNRHYSHYLALQLKARHAGLDTPVYGLAPVHHTH